MSKTLIENARAYVNSMVQEPALQNELLSEVVKRKVKHSQLWLNQFERVGDLLTYLKRFDKINNDPTYVELKKLNIKTFEDIVGEFEEKFSLWAYDCTRASDFVIGESYNAFQILIFAKNYDTRSGGMFVLYSGGKPSSVIIKATLNGGRYPNAWISEPSQLKYYLKSIKNDFGEHFKPNAAIIENPLIPILTFVRNSDEETFVYHGVFNYLNIHRETDGSKWFELIQVMQQTTDILADSKYIASKLKNEIKVSSQSSRENRLARLAKAEKKPKKIQVISTAYIRNPDVVTEVLFRANGVCECCKEEAPFIKRSDSTPYLEVHHKITLANGGDDSVENAIALCPNCHRKFHFG